MYRASSRFPAAALCAAALLAACSKGDKTADSSRTADSTASGAMTATSATPAAAPAPAAAAPLTDPNIFALLDEANVADSSDGAIAATKGTNAEVKSFGREMMKDHHALRKGGQDLATKLTITPQPPAGDTLASHASAFKDSLTTMPAGAAWDKAYITHEVAMHQAVLQMAQTAQGAAQNADLKAMIEKAAPIVQQHLDHAKSIQSKLQ